MKKIIENLNNLFVKLIGSFEINNSGFSSRKLTAFVLMALIIIIHFKWMKLNDFSQLISVLTIDYAFIAALFGMTTYHALKKDEKKDEPKDNPDSDENMK